MYWMILKTVLNLIGCSNDMVAIQYIVKNMNNSPYQLNML